MLENTWTLPSCSRHSFCANNSHDEICWVNWINDKFDLSVGFFFWWSSARWPDLSLFTNQLVFLVVPTWKSHLNHHSFLLESRLQYRRPNKFVWPCELMAFSIFIYLQLYISSIHHLPFLFRQHARVRCIHDMHVGILFFAFSWSCH